MQNQNSKFQETAGIARDEKTYPLKIRFSCKNCGCKYVVDSKYSGKKGKCKKCGSDIQVPHY
jgi:transposase-like protein